MWVELAQLTFYAGKWREVCKQPGRDELKVKEAEDPFHGKDS